MNTNNNLLRFAAILVFLLLVLGVLGVFSSSIFLKILNVLWIIVVVGVLIFVFIGILVILGLRKEAEKILDILLEGSLTIVDFMDFLKKAFDQFLLILKQLLEYLAPFLAIILNLVLYFLLLYIFKSVGKLYDVTSLAIVLTIVLVVGLSFLDFGKKPESEGQPLWINIIKEKFLKTFRDGFEVVIFIFFLTMDSTNLFFLPDSLNTEVKAVILDYDLMKRGFTLNNHLNITVILVVTAIAVEILRFVLRIGKVALVNYNVRLSELITQGISERKAIMIKNAIRKGVSDSKKGIMKFITFTTFLIIVFLLFPRLKVLLLLVTSLTALVLDILKTERLVIKDSDDLINRVLTKLFRMG